MVNLRFTKVCDNFYAYRNGHNYFPAHSAEGLHNRLFPGSDVKVARGHYSYGVRALGIFSFCFTCLISYVRVFVRFL